MQQRGGISLYYVEQLIQAGKHQEALRSLAVYLKSNPDSADAWWLLSQAVTDRKQQLECLERVLKLNPEHAPARTLLEKRKGTAKRNSFPPPAALTSPPHIDRSPLTAPPTEALRTAKPGLSHTGPVPGKRPPGTTKPSSNVSRPVKRRAAGKNKMSASQISVLAVLICILTASVGTLGALGLRQKMAIDQQATQIMAQAWASHPAKTLPPTWTATTTFTPLPSRTAAPTETPSPTVVLSMPATNTHALSGWVSITLRSSAPSGPAAPDFTLKEVTSGNQVSLGDYQGRPVVLVFFTTWCPYCEREMPALKSTYKTYQDAGLVILAINEGDSASDVRSYRKSHGLNFPVLLDPKRKAGGLYKVASYPMHVFINRSGQVVYTVKGMMDSAGLSSGVQMISR